MLSTNRPCQPMLILTTLALVLLACLPRIPRCHLLVMCAKVAIESAVLQFASGEVVYRGYD